MTTQTQSIPSDRDVSNGSPQPLSFTDLSLFFLVLRAKSLYSMSSFCSEWRLSSGTSQRSRNLRWREWWWSDAVTDFSTAGNVCWCREEFMGWVSAWLLLFRIPFWVPTCLDLGLSLSIFGAFCKIRGERRFICGFKVEEKLFADLELDCYVAAEKRVWCAPEPGAI